MTSITARLHFRFPYALTSEYLTEGFAEVSQTGKHRLQLTARIPATAIELSKTVIAECEPDADAIEPAWMIRWSPEPGGVYPSFKGRLRAYANESDGTTILELTGNYAPPLGAAGLAFDHVLGRKITSDTAHDLLANLAAEMKARYAFEEAREAFDDTRKEPDQTPASQ